MSDIENDKLFENLYEKHLEMVSKKIKDIGKAEQEARILAEEEMEDNQ